MHHEVRPTRAGRLALMGRSPAVALMAASVFLAACGGSSQAPAPAATTAAPAAVATLPPTTTVAPVQTAAAPAATPKASASSSADAALLAQGKLVFDVTAKGVGCAYCHGFDGAGHGSAPGVNAPDIRGKTESDLRAAMQSLQTMTDVHLTEEEIVAVSAYLATLK